MGGGGVIGEGSGVDPVPSLRVAHIGSGWGKRLVEIRQDVFEGFHSN